MYTSKELKENYDWSLLGNKDMEETFGRQYKFKLL